jgi:hypothetical protein
MTRCWGANHEKPSFALGHPLSQLYHSSRVVFWHPCNVYNMPYYIEKGCAIPACIDCYVDR